MPSKISPPLPIQVQQMTCADLSCLRFSLKACAEGAGDGPPSELLGRSTQNFKSSGLTASGLPSLTTLSPAAAHPSTRLSTAMLESEVASTGRPRHIRLQRLRIRMATAVFPVPGGPWIRVSRLAAAPHTAMRCESLTSSTLPYFSMAKVAIPLSSSSLSSSPRPRLWFSPARSHPTARLQRWAVEVLPTRWGWAHRPCAAAPSMVSAMFSSMAVMAVTSSSEGRRAMGHSPPPRSGRAAMMRAASSCRLKPMRLASLSTR
mmetsp:Transcript_42634/g.99984  ORF Transcript_42634/g.99984 Transcript_42634/m.99984 type:complete len:261 (-) Transcript_42634:1243-2025(-)